MSNPSTVYVVHTIDTEGPLYESLEFYNWAKALKNTQMPM